MNAMLLNIVAATNTSHASNNLISPLKFQASLGNSSPGLLDSIDSHHQKQEVSSISPNYHPSSRQPHDSIDPLLLLDEACGFFDVAPNSSSSSSPLNIPSNVWEIDGHHRHGQATSSSSLSSSNPTDTNSLPLPIKPLIAKTAHPLDPVLGYHRQVATETMIPRLPPIAAAGGKLATATSATASNTEYDKVYDSLMHMPDFQPAHWEPDPSRRLS
jgi:hypothetical protein